MQWWSLNAIIENQDFSWTSVYITRAIRVTYKEKKSFAFLKHPIQNKRLLRLQTVCCNSLACSKNNKPHEGVCSLAIASLPSWFDYTLFLSQSLSCYRAPWMGTPARHTGQARLQNSPFQYWPSAQITDIILKWTMFSSLWGRQG